MNATLQRRTTQWQFSKDLRSRYDGDVTIHKMESDTEKGWMYLYYTSCHKSITGDRHCGTWSNGEGWEFI